MPQTDPATAKIAALLDNLSDDSSIPRNVRGAFGRAKDKLLNEKDRLQALSGAGYALDEVSNDINMPMHARTMIWNILSELEILKDESRKE